MNVNILGPLRLGLLAGLLLGAQAQAVRAAEVVAAQEYDKYIDKHKTIHPLDWSLFGEQINARDGGVSFKVVDGELEGAGPTLKIVRTFKLRETNRFVDTSGTEAIGWNFEVPRMKTVVNATAGTIDSPYGWQVPGADKNARCSHFAAPGLIRFADFARLWDDHEWWSGYQIVDDTGNEQEVLRATSPETQAAGFVAVTSGNWRLSCLASTSNGQPGEAFLAIAPDGTRYWFDYLVYTNADSMSKTYEQTPSYKQAERRRANREGLPAAQARQPALEPHARPVRKRTCLPLQQRGACRRHGQRRPRDEVRAHGVRADDFAGECDGVALLDVRDGFQCGRGHLAGPERLGLQLRHARRDAPSRPQGPR